MKFYSCVRFSCGVVEAWGILFAFKSLMGGFDVVSMKTNVGSGLRMLANDESRI